MRPTRRVESESIIISDATEREREREKMAEIMGVDDPRSLLLPRDNGGLGESAQLISNPDSSSSSFCIFQ